MIRDERFSKARLIFLRNTLRTRSASRNEENTPFRTSSAAFCTISSSVMYFEYVVVEK